MGPRTPWLGLMVTTLLVGLGLTEDADGARGVEATLLPSLTREEQAGLEASARVLRENGARVLG